MRLREQLDAIPPADQQQLLNQLTLGCGRLAQAARLVLADAPCGRILDTLTAAQAPLAGVAAQLDGSAVPAPPDRGAPSGARTGLRALSWQEFLATQPPADATVLRADLEAMAHQTRELIRAVQADAEAAHVTGHLVAVSAALSDLRARLAAVVEP
jgi:hypothetical protein